MQLPELEFKDVVANSTTIAQVFEHFKMRKSGAAYQAFYNRCKVLNLSIEHFTGERKVQSRGVKQPLNKVLVIDSTYMGSSNLKARLYSEGLKTPKCENPKCGMTEWLGSPISFELDHINGIRNDNRIENLRILCPNCHAQTETYCRGERLRKQFPTCSTIGCEIKISGRATNCRTHASLLSLEKAKLVNKLKIVWPDPVWILDKLENTTYTDLGKEIGVSDSSIKKFLRRNGFEPPRKYNYFRA